MPPVSPNQFSRLPSAPTRHRALQWTCTGMLGGVFLLALCMVQVWLYAWSKTEQERLDGQALEVWRLRSQIRLKSNQYSRAINEFEVRPAEEAAYRRLTPDRVDRIEVPRSPGNARAVEAAPQPKQPGPGLLRTAARETRRFLSFILYGEEDRDG